ncbi:MAG TPA: 16S rRNA (adenine(1518)-N(6)/adenine(1519)-N(6))-dimethyltransferase RsmA [Pirellulaceae bacterium]|nr:16S rRNA (adenine(1518)-N(6)/adenine(1519)-N(6))-dimethyltransferase RsmA [Pirellulaceae bacterium]
MHRFREAGFEPYARHGQNFLIDLNLLNILLDAANLGPNDVVLEIGTGMGTLTTQMASRVAHVVTVEIDDHLYQLASEELIDFDNVTMLHHDALKNKNTIDPRVIETVRQHLNAAPGRQFKLVANLPYNIATPILSNLLETAVVPVSMTVTIQKEVAERIIAGPRTKDYSALSIWMQAMCDVELLRVLGPTVFWPRPKVDSAIIQVRPNPEKRALIPDIKFFHEFVRALFFHRRKFLRSVVLSALKDRLDKPAVDEVLQQLGFGADARAEQLDVATLLTLSEALRQKVLSAAG